MTKLLSLYGLKFHPFRPDVPTEALFTTPAVDSFVRRVELGVADGGFAMLIGDPGTGKSVALRLLAERLRACPTSSSAPSSTPRAAPWTSIASSVTCSPCPSPPITGGPASRRFAPAGADHIGSSRCRPVLIIDEAQEALTPVLCELRILASKELDSKQLLCVVFAGDARLPERRRSPELLPLGSRIRRRLTLDYASRDELLACLDHLLVAAGNPSLMTSELRVTLADHAAGNYRVLMNLGDELLAVAADRELARLDEKLFLDVFAQTPKPKPAATTARKR
jgi:type II secretory pathway predicted ATPase ExeA